MDKNNPIDVDFEEEQKNEKQIHGKPLYFSTGQVATLIGESDSTLRFWCLKFKDILHIETTGTHRRFKEEDIEKIKYIQKLLREENYSINQVIEYCSEEQVGLVEEKLKDNNPLAIQALAAAVGLDIKKQVENIKFEMMEYFSNELKHNFNKQNEIIDKKLDTNHRELSITLDAKEQEAKNRDVELLDTLRKGMEDRKRESEIKESQKKGFWVRLFKKKI